MSCPACGTEVPGEFSFCGHCGARLDRAASASRTPPAPRSASAERREVTVLFADMQGFTSIGEKLDPEQLRALVNECFAGLGRAIQAEGGHIDKYIGDNVMALFGAPVAHEDDPARACRAALAMQAFMAAFGERAREEAGGELRMRIGIHCGLVVAGAVGSDVRMDYSVMGDAVNQASRLESAAPPGSVLISRSVASRTRGRFRLGPPIRLTVKGKAKPVEAYELLGEIEDAAAGAAAASPWQGAPPVPLVGRRDELRELVNAVRDGRGWVEVRGEIGIGKTRLVDEAARSQGWKVLVIAGTTAARRRPFGLIGSLVLDVARHLGGGPSRPGTHADFTDALGRLGEEVGAFGAVFWYLASPEGELVAPPDPDPQTLRRMVERGVVVLLAALGREAPGLTVVLDSYDLADEASAQLFGALRGTLDASPVRFIATARDEGPGRLRPEAALRLEPLRASDASELLGRLTRGAALPAELEGDLLARAAGVPLFIEEIVRSLVDQELLEPAGEGWRWREGAPARVSLPSSIRAAMVARLDRVQRPARELLCQCAVQGVEFDLEIAEAVRGLPGRQGPPLPTLLPSLEGLGLITVERAREPGQRAFRQPLFQEACYETLLVSDRKALHGETADALLAARDCRPASPTLLAHHYERAERWSPAAGANLEAGIRAADLFLNDEATRRFGRALEALDRVTAPSQGDDAVRGRTHVAAARAHLRVGAYRLAEEHARLLKEISIQDDLRAEAGRLVAAARVHTGRTAEGEALLREAVATARRSAWSGEVLARALYDLAQVALRAGRTGEALALLGDCRKAVGAERRLVSIRADMLEGRIAHTEGRFAEAARLYARAYEQAQAVGSLSEQAAASNDLGNAARDDGDYDTAARCFRRALEVWQRTGDAECVAGAHNNLGNVAMSRGDFAAARAHYERSLAAAREIENVHGAALAQSNLALLALEEGDGPSALRSAEAALRTLGGSANELLRGPTLVVVGEGHLACGDPAAAQEVFEKVLGDYDEGNQPLAVAGALRGAGRVALWRGAPEEALRLFDGALRAFERLGRVQEAARTSLYRAEALRAMGDVEGARADLEAGLERLASIGANRDAARAQRRLRELAVEETTRS